MADPSCTRGEQAYLIYCDNYDTLIVRDWDDLTLREQAEWNMAFPGQVREDEPFLTWVREWPRPGDVYVYEPREPQPYRTPTSAYTAAPTPSFSQIPNSNLRSSPVDAATSSQDLTAQLGNSQDTWTASSNGRKTRDNDPSCPPCRRSHCGGCKGGPPCIPCKGRHLTARQCQGLDNSKGFFGGKDIGWKLGKKDREDDSRQDGAGAGGIIT
ncbi:uncharacterized protein LY89DRAFT_726837 [Mollisia scopiformis]|uniref:Uncharacterized protein n=1 Tax=Mollisia scopiformis TaxID=149040 RepID=A0A194XVP0_MOLSC|nr:uncharacterized protein LY89DRAFT_726837 [Mollisia scopiformis]KUJ23777.1 hypothetical protein LY89DRAFT_726837 [Mollisia scopiformis]